MVTMKNETFLNAFNFSNLFLTVLVDFASFCYKQEAVGTQLLKCIIHK